MKPVRVLVAPNAFKGSLSAADAARLIAHGLREARRDVVVQELPIADGGDGTRAVLAAATHARTEMVRTPGADGEPRLAPLTWLADDHALVESASIAGLPHDEAKRDPFTLSTVGVGVLTRAAVVQGATTVEIALGGTGTVDGGLGFLARLGVDALDDDKQPCPVGGAGLLTLAHLDLFTLDKRVRNARLIGLCDVDNRLLGPHGARMYMRQKGASPADCDQLENGLGRLAALAGDKEQLALTPGAGAAGGLGFAVALCGGELVSGAERVLDLLRVDAAIAKSHVVITGEGRLDEQTARGKAPAALAARARAAGKRVIALVGTREGEPADEQSSLFDEVRALTDDGTPAEYAMREPEERLRSLAADVARAL
jgi:glycerate kinase